MIYWQLKEFDHEREAMAWLNDNKADIKELKIIEWIPIYIKILVRVKFNPNREK